MAAGTINPKDAAQVDSTVVCYGHSSLYGRWFPLVMIAFLVWVAGLVILCVTTANPPTLNRVQVLQSDVVIAGRSRLGKDWKSHDVEAVLLNRTSEEIPTRIKILLEHQPPMKDIRGTVRLYPIQRSASGEWVITPASVPKFPEITYPDTPAIRQQIQELK